jgi:hypothetical protein
LQPLTFALDALGDDRAGSNPQVGRAMASRTRGIDAGRLDGEFREVIAHESEDRAMIN